VLAKIYDHLKMKYLTYQQVISFSTLTEHQIGRETPYKVPQSSAHTFPPWKYWPRTKAEMASNIHRTVSYAPPVRLHFFSASCPPLTAANTEFLKQSYALLLFLITMYMYICIIVLWKL